MTQPLTVADLSETELLARFTPRLPRGGSTRVGPGDDAAVVRLLEPEFVVTTDVLVQDRHFRLDWGTAADLGWRAAMQNLADVAAMGAVPTAITLALVMPGSTPVTWVEELADGLAQACAPHDVGVVGGDLSSGDFLVLSVTAFGECEQAEPVLRSGARPGDVLAVAGTLGRSAAGLALLAAAEDGLVVTDDALDFIATFLRPDPPLLAGPEAAAARASAMLDVSDGLLRDAGRIAAASKASLNLESRLLAPDVEALESAAEQVGADPVDWVLTGGEDHSLLATFPAGRPLPPSFRRIGTVTEGVGVLLDGKLPVAKPGWDHFRG